MPDDRPVLSLAHSADADDVFMWWPITGKIDGRDPGRVVSPPVLDTGRFRYRAVPEDIQALNARAAERGDLEITALSFHAYPHVRARYALTACGWSMGEGYGPKVVVGAGQAGGVEGLRGRRVAVPGVQTTAFLVLSLMLGPDTFVPVPMPFDRIAGAVSANAADGGVLIHEAQIDFARLGLREVADLGAWWLSTTGLPLPLGGNAVRRDLDARFGPGALAEVGSLLRASILHALEHRGESLAYARTFSPPISDADLDRYVRMYVTPLTVDPRPRGVRAVKELFDRGWRAGLNPAIETLELVG